MSWLIEKYARLLHEDYVKAHESLVVSIRSILYSRFYKVAPIRVVKQEKPVVFVDSGIFTESTNVSSLTLMRLGAIVREENGRLVTLAHYSGKPSAKSIETLIVYSNIGWDGLIPVFKFSIEPVDEHSLLFNEGDTDRVSREVSWIINRGIKESFEIKKPGQSPRKVARYLMNIHKYIISMLEVAYLARILEFISDGIGVVDGSLQRWFGVKYAGMPPVDGFSILSVLSGVGKSKLKEILIDKVTGLTKTSSLTSLASAYSLFMGNSIVSKSGAYGYVDSESAGNAATVLKEIVEKMGVDLGREAAAVFNRIVFQKKDEVELWRFRVPVASEGFQRIFHAEYYIDKPIITVSSSGVKVNEDLAGKLGEKAHYTVNQVFSKVSGISGTPPYGLMEVDRMVRLDRDKSRVYHEVLILALRRAVGRGNHPLIQAFEASLRMRYGYR